MRENVNDQKMIEVPVFAMKAFLDDIKSMVCSLIKDHGSVSSQGISGSQRHNGKDL